MSAPAVSLAQLQQWFEQALELPPSQWEAFVEQACAGDADGAQQLRRLLRTQLRLAHSDTQAVFGDVDAAVAAALPGVLGEGGHIGPYRLLGQIGLGGMGRVFRAERSGADFRQTVAIKLLRQELVNPSLLRRFSLERKLLAQLDHPGICRLIDAGTLADATPYAVMEYVDGTNLFDHADRHQLTLEQRLLLFRQVLAAVSYAHQRLVVHRDIKAGNILVDGDGHIRLLDFGIAKAIDGALDATATGDRYLSFSNAAPEQLLGQPVTVACDTYALGGVLYELLCGLPPFELDGIAETSLHARILHTPPPPMSRRIQAAPVAVAGARRLATVAALQRRLGGDLECIVQKCLRKEAALRYATVQHLDEDIAGFLQHRPIRAADGRHAYRLRKFVARNALTCALAAALVLALTAALAAMLVRNAEAVRERDRAQQALVILRSAFLSADPARVAGEAVTVRAVLDAALPALQPYQQAQPELYASLAGSIAEVQLSLGLSTDAAELFDRAALAAQRASIAPAEHSRLLVVRGRALFAAGEFERAQQSLQQALDTGVAPTPEWKIVQSGVVANTGNSQGAAALLREAIGAMHERPVDDEWAHLARLRLAELLGQNDAAAEGLQVLDATLQWQRGALDALHPRVTLTRLQRVIALRQLGRHDEALAEAGRVRDDAIEAYGADSPFAARAAMVRGNVQIGLKRRSEALASYREAVAVYAGSVGETNPNTLRASYNLAEVLAQEAAQRAEALALYRRTLAAAEQRFGARSNAVVLFRNGYARSLLADSQAVAALAVLTTSAAAQGLTVARSANRRDFIDLLRRSHAAACSEAGGPAATTATAVDCAAAVALLPGAG